MKNKLKSTVRAIKGVLKMKGGTVDSAGINSDHTSPQSGHSKADHSSIKFADSEDDGS